MTRASGYRVEPYAIAAEVAGADPRLGQGGWTWYTGSAAWTWRLVIEGMIGLRLRDGKLTIGPVRPADWPWFEAEIAGPLGSISLRVDNPDSITGGTLETFVEGTEVPPGSPIDFPTDGSTRRICARIRISERSLRAARAHARST